MVQHGDDGDGSDGLGGDGSLLDENHDQRPPRSVRGLITTWSRYGI